MEAGWLVANEVEKDRIATYCPLHKDNHTETKEA